MINGRKISLAMVVKDEGQTLDKAISSVFDYVDEVVVGVDSTSSDDSLKIAKKWVRIKGEGKAFQFDWQDSFAAARNLVMSRCSNDWIFILDGHEYLESESVKYLENLFSFVEEDEPDSFAFLIHMKDTPGKSKALQHRLFRKSFRYDGDIHNQIQFRDDHTTVGIHTIVIAHDRPPALAESRAAQRREMYERKFMEELSEDPNSTKANYYMGVWCSNARRYREAVTYFDRYLDHSDWHIERAKVLCFAGMALREIGDVERSESYFKRAITERFDCADGYIELGDLAARRLDESETKEDVRWYSREAEFYYKCATALDLPLDSVFLDNDSYTWKPWVKLASLYERMVNDHEQFHVVPSLIQSARTALMYDTVPEDIRDQTAELYNTFLAIYKQAAEEVEHAELKEPVLSGMRVT